MSHSWFPFPPEIDDPEIRVFCFPHAGGNASFYRDWRGRAGHIEFYPVQLPGHGNRLGEPPLTCLEDLVSAFAEAAAPLLDRPFALFGHSFGAWLAYAAAHQVRTEYGQSARHLFVSGNVPPPHALDPNRVLLGNDQDSFEYMNIISETPVALIDNKEFISHILPIFRTDINLLRNYADENKINLTSPITAFLGLQDPLHSHEKLLNWKDRTSGSFEHHLFPGDHFYLKNYIDDITLIIASSLEL